MDGLSNVLTCNDFFFFNFFIFYMLLLSGIYARPKL